ncbi:DUF2169 family type VI secretion system accessory protein [Sorangium sp. So ce385]|uniref:DUF2169 family type VI secretion system accessory protein n=1 Tax=Sorangium sp. So ce385 TaxID=3133308 RepID=UPI003F5B266F
MSLSNATPFPALDVTFADESGRDVASVIVKGTFVLDANGRAVPAEEPSPVRVADELYAPENTWSSAKYPSDLCWAKVGTDVVVVGAAMSARPVSVADVVVRAQGRSVPLRVHGHRLYYRSVTRVAIGPAVPFEETPIVYERAYGGVSADLTLMENRNPAGVGLARKPADLEGMPAPQIEHPAHPHTGAGDDHPPVGYGSILPFWSPRRELAGTFDAGWQSARMPLFPKDFDLRFNNVAHPSLIFERGLAPGEPVAVLGMSPAPFHVELPHLAVVVRARFDASGKKVVRPPIDTVLIEPARRRVEIVARATFPVGRGYDVLRELRVDLDDG